ncbi:M48 family metalloprotease [Gammaproteobacteria bacterium]|nr:M48 family metalloprotease [Gammaproteobacteria bacterium]
MAALLLQACATNPVTGNSDLMLFSEAEELELGEKNYATGRQTSGGDYLVDPELTDYVTSVMDRLAKVSGRDLPYELNICNDSSFNAWAMAGGKFCINRGALLAVQSEAELAALLGHEMVHAAARHTVRARSNSKAFDIGVQVLAVAVATEAPEAVGAVHTLGGFGGKLTGAKFSRDHEREADHYGMIFMQGAGYDPAAMIVLHKRLGEASGKRNFSYYDTHPITDERVRNSRVILKEIGAGGTIGKERYQKMTAGLRSREKHYVAVDRGVNSLMKQGKVEEAKKVVDDAIAAVPGEAAFLAAKADLARYLGYPRVAQNYYGKAMKADPDHFYPYLMMSSYILQSGQRRLAEQYARRSYTLLPTKQATQLVYALAQ